jgi:tRNA pseudouridine38-40 synthase
MRYFLTLAYNGTRFYGWQSQPSGITIQKCIEESLATVLRKNINVIGCGRTDTGVHSAHYVLHFDYTELLPNRLLQRLNHLVGKDIVLYQLWEMQPESHARFDATSRSYYYQIATTRSPFAQETTYFFCYSHQIDRDAMQNAAAMLLEYEEFAPFCKANHQALTMRCKLTRCEWVFDDVHHQWIFYITANRFLRGMIRLIVGTCLNIGLGKMSIDDLRQAMDTQKPLPKPLSVPPQGLFLNDIIYPSHLFLKQIE